ncbi:MAG: class I SAM-dependent DNA methyltransferase [Candidatus Omnitrophota bacterium]|nr:class I SAM-dependent DNA methyltransferase [Candidatus Omnitrophota bacterium]
MPKLTTPRTTTPQTTAQSLGSLIKSCRDIMRKDKGLSTDLDRLPMLTWIMFLKFLDDMEQIRETEAKLAGKRFQLAIECPYRWRDWAAKPDGITGDALVAFINQEEAVRPDGKKGPGLFAYLRALRSANGGDRRDVIRAVFQGTVNRMLSGYLLRDIVNKINNIHFTSTEEIYTLGHLYESMLREMRDAAGENGEFYTPRPVVQFVVTAINPRLGETVLDPASGTGGFLAAAFEHLKKQCKKTEDHHRLQRESFFGIEAKPLPYLLCQMNLLLHGLEYPQIDPGNALRVPLREIGDKDRVDVIMTNPPFGGEEERGILGNFQDDKQTAETALLFLQLIMRKLRRPIGGKSAGRCGVVVPNGTLFGDGVCARIKEELLKEFNLHTIVRLPNGVFSPYTGIPTNVLFFDRSGPTQNVWYYEQLLPDGRKNYTKTQPLQFEEFADCIAWWGKRVENDRAWKVPAAEFLANGCNLDRKNPSAKEDFEHLPPEQLADDILKREQRIAAIMAEIKTVLAQKT